MCTSKGVLSSSWLLNFYILASSGTPAPHHDGIVTMRVLLLLSLATIFLAEPCQPKPMQLACTRKGVLSSSWSLFSHLSKQWHHPHLGGGGFLLWGAACAPKGGMCSEHLSDSWPSRLVPTLVVVPTWVFISTFSDTAGCLQPTTIVAIW